MAWAFLQKLKISKHLNHMRHDVSRRFYLAVLIERLTFAPRYDISLLRTRASHVRAPAIPQHALAPMLSASAAVAAATACGAESSSISDPAAIN
jgi:hypothetical protein